MTAADDAYRFAQGLIAEAKRERAWELSFDRDEMWALEVLPPEIGGLDFLQYLTLSKTNIQDLTPLSGLTALTNLSLDGMQVSNLAPLSGMAKLEVLGLEVTRVSDLAPLRGLRALRMLGLRGTQVSDLAPLSSLTALRSLSIEGTQVCDLAPLSGLTALKQLSLDETQVSDLRPLLPLRGSLVPGEGAQDGGTGVRFRGTLATRADATLAEIAEITDNRERNQRLFDYLEGWVPPLGPGDAPEQDALLPVSEIDGRLEIAASLPSEAERDERLKRVLHERLQLKAAELAQMAGNRFPRLAARARALVAQVEKPFEQLDMLLLHLEVEDLAGRVTQGEEGGEAYSPEVSAALADVARLGPGLTLDNPDVEKLLERTRRFEAGPPAPGIRVAHDEMSEAVASDATAIGDGLRALERRNVETAGLAATGAVQVAVHRNILWRIGAGLAGAGGQLGIGVAAGMIVNAQGPAIGEFVTSNWQVLVQVASSYGPAFADWFIASVAPTPELRARLPDARWREREGHKK